MASPSLTSGAAIRLRIAAAMRYRRSYLVVLLFALAVTQCCCAGQQSSSSSPFPALLNAPPLPQLAPLLSAPRPIASLDSSNSTHTRYRYIVVLSPTISPANLSSVIDGILPANASVHKLLIGPPPSLSLGLSVNPSFNAFSAYLSPAQLAAVRASPLVSYVEQDGLISLDLDVDLVHIDALSHHSGSGQASIAQVDNSNPLYSWGLDRIGKRRLPLDGGYDITVGSDGSGVTAYMIDTGCRTTHQELKGRASVVYTLFNNGKEDQHGHGTHTAGIVGGAHVGVANRITLACLSVLDSTGSGAYSSVVGAMQWVQAHASGPSVLSMSLGGSYSQAINDQAAVLMAAGIACVSASGNSAIGTTCQTDVTGISPASTPGLIVAAASNISDSFSPFDNYGECVTMAAPGEQILSAWGSGDTVYAIASGTSMACPFVAGVASLYLNGHPSASHNEVKASLLCSATSDALSNQPPSTANLLLYANVQPCATASSSGTADFLALSSSSSSAAASSSVLPALDPAVGADPLEAPHPLSPPPPGLPIQSTTAQSDIDSSSHPTPSATINATHQASGSTSSSGGGGSAGSSSSSSTGQKSAASDAPAAGAELLLCVALIWAALSK